jgi:glucosylceramidase
MKWILSTEAGQRWQSSPFDISPVSEGIPLVIDVQKKFQTHLGFGGSLTEAAAYTIKENQSSNFVRFMIEKYYSQKGLNYLWTRIHMNSSDFSLGNYTYVNHGDVSLDTFSIAREEMYVLPVLREIIKLQPNLKILISPWSPPGWMKDNQQMNHGGSLLPEYRETWARYYVKFIQALNANNIHPWGVSVQNEPAAKQVWDSCIYSAEQERDFIKFYLGPTLRKTFGDAIQILAWDHNRDIMLDRVKPIYQDPEASQYVWGTAFHWYGEEAFSNVGKTAQAFPNKHLLFTEGCIEGGPRPGSWETGERYARNIIGDFNNGNEGFIDWNLVLNEQGGPNHVGNFCDAPILFDRRTQKPILNSSYYAIGHFSKFIPPGSIRVSLETILPNGVSAVAYQLPEQDVVLVFLNTTKTNYSFSVKIKNKVKTFTLPAKAIGTLILDEKESLKNYHT